LEATVQNFDISTWRKLQGASKEWSLLLERYTLTNQFCRFCFSIKKKGTSERVASQLTIALKEKLPGTAVSSFRARLTRPGATDDPFREREVIKELQAGLRELRIVSAGSYPMMCRLKINGPADVYASELLSEVRFKSMPNDFVLARVLRGEYLELQVKVEWGKGQVQIEESLINNSPNSWISLSRDYSPVRTVNFEIERDLVFGEIYTDGSVSPEDAILRAFHHI
jgi:DNA-directed RNA polymerase alpha subunit